MSDQMPDKTYTLLGPDRRPYESPVKGTLGGRCDSSPDRRVYGTMDCPAALRAIAEGTYVDNRVFFADEATAIAAGFRPCGKCMRERYDEWKKGGTPGTDGYPWLVTP